MKKRSTRSAARIGGLRDLLEELCSASIFTLIEHEDGFLQDRRDIFGERFTDVAAKQAAHGISPFQ
jgi:hypothetical protein